MGLESWLEWWGNEKKVEQNTEKHESGGIESSDRVAPIKQQPETSMCLDTTHG